jgi:hypothetical protein
VQAISVIYYLLSAFCCLQFELSYLWSLVSLLSAICSFFFQKIKTHKAIRIPEPGAHTVHCVDPAAVAKEPYLHGEHARAEVPPGSVL